ncbi:hypothetical protein HDV63DRAFT_414485 [Trichoderma sp. SZMC 28014]
MEITKLEHWTDWFRWKKDVMSMAMLCGFKDLLERDSKPTIRDGETQRAFEKRLEFWEHSQRQAVAVVRCSLGFSLLRDTKDMKTLVEVMDKVDTWFQLYKTLAFRVLNDEYDNLTLEGSASVAEYADNLGELWAKIGELDESCKIGEPFLILKFLSGLGENYGTFNTFFRIKHNLLPEYEDGKLIKRAVTFLEAVDAAKLHEWLLKQEQKDPGVTSHKNPLGWLQSDVVCGVYYNRADQSHTLYASASQSAPF